MCGYVRACGRVLYECVCECVCVGACVCTRRREVLDASAGSLDASARSFGRVGGEFGRVGERTFAELVPVPKWYIAYVPRRQILYDEASKIFVAETPRQPILCRRGDQNAADESKDFADASIIFRRRVQEVRRRVQNS